MKLNITEKECSRVGNGWYGGFVGYGGYDRYGGYCIILKTTSPDGSLNCENKWWGVLLWHCRKQDITVLLQCTTDRRAQYKQLLVMIAILEIISNWWQLSTIH